MKRILFTITLLFAVLMCRTPPVQADMDYSLSDYLTNKAYIGAGNYNDPLWQLWTELDASLINAEGAAFLLLTPGTAPTATEGTLYYDSTGKNLKLRTDAAWVDIDVSGASSLDAAYGIGAGITVDAGAVTLTATDAANNDALTIVQSDTAGASALVITNAGTGASIEIDGAGTGDDITGTGDLWTISEAGVASLVGVSVGASDIVFTEPTTNDVTLLADGDGILTISAGSMEDIDINLATANTLTLTSSTAMDKVNWGALDAHSGLNTLAFDVAVANSITQAGTGATDDLTIEQTASGVDASLILQSSGTGTDALSLISSVADISLVSADNITRTAADNITDVLTDGGYTLTIGGATNGKYISTVADTYSMVAVDAVTIQNTEAAKNITVNSVLGSIYIEAEEDAANAILITGDGGTSTTVKVHNDTGTSTTEGAASLQLTSDVGSIELLSGLNAADAINIMVDASTAAGITIFNDTGTAAAATTESDASIQLLSDVGGIGLLSNGNIANAIRIEADGGTSETVAISSVKGTGVASIDIDSTVGGVTISANAAGKDVSIDSVLGSINLEAEEDSATAISIQADGGTASGVWIESLTGTSVTEDTAAVEIRATVGGINIQSDANLDDAIMIRVDGGTTSEITIHNDQGNTADSIELLSDAGGITLNGAVGGVVFTAGQTRTEIFNITDVTVDSTVPPAAATLGTTAQDEFATLGFDANPNATGDDYVFIKWLVPAGYVADSAELHCYWSFSDAEDAADECVIDGTVNAIAPTAGAGEAPLGAGTAMAAVTSVITDASATMDTLIKTTLDIEVEDIAVGDLVSIAFFFDESACLMAASGTADVYYWTITYESTE